MSVTVKNNSDHEEDERVSACKVSFAQFMTELQNISKKKFSYTSGYYSPIIIYSGDPLLTEGDYAFKVTENTGFLRNPLRMSVFIKDIRYKSSKESKNVNVKIQVKDTTLMPSILQAVSHLEKKLQELFEKKVNIEILK